MTELHDIQAEQSVLGALLLSEMAFDEVRSMGLDAAHFSDVRHRAIYAACVESVARGVPVDIVPLKDALKDKLPDAGIYLSSLLDACPAAANVGHYAAIVLDYAKRRGLQLAAKQAVADLQRGVPLDAARNDLAKALEQTLNLAQLDAGKLGYFLGRNVGLTAAKSLPWGWHWLDDRTGGIPEAALTVIGAYPSVGKTAVATSVLTHLARAGTPVAFFSVEMSASQVIQSLLARQSGVPYHELRRHGPDKVQGDKAQRIAEVLVRMGDWPFFIVAGSASSSTIAATARVLIRKHGVRLIAVDYLQLLAVPDAESRRVAIDESVRELKALAQATGVSVLLLSQMSRQSGAGANPVPTQHVLKESGGILEAADVVVLLHREHWRRPALAGGDDSITFLVEKNRFGEAGFDVPMRWDGPRMTITDG